MISIPIITKIADGIPTCTTVTEWAGTATIPGTILGTTPGITVTDITAVGTARGTVVGTRPGITVAGTAHGTIAAGIHPGITADITIPGITVTADTMEADITAVSTMDTTVV